MKINEKNLSLFATTPPVDLEGWLNKKGELNKSWQRRWFVLKGNLLFYFEKRGDREPLGVIILEGCTIELAEDGEQYCFQIVFHGINNRTYQLSAETQELMEQWMKAFTCAGYEYMKLMVAELQRQLEEIENQPISEMCESPVAPKPPPRRQNPFNRPVPAPDNVRTGAETVTAMTVTRTAPPPPTMKLPNHEQAIAVTTNAITILTTATPIALNNANETLPTMILSANKPATMSGGVTTVTTTPTTIVSGNGDTAFGDYSFPAVHKAFGHTFAADLQRRRNASRNLIEMPLIEF